MEPDPGTAVGAAIEVSSGASEELATAPQPATAPPPSIPRQRWRLVVARDALPSAPAGRELADAWESAVDGTGLPLHRPVGRARARVAFGAPVPAAIALERELAEIVLTEMVPVWRVREALDGRLPDGWRLVDLYDVWLGAPALASKVAAADYRVTLGDVAEAAMSAAAAALLAANRLPRERMKGGLPVPYDLRPLVVGVWVIDAGPPLLLRIRTLSHPSLGTGRPDEVVAALGGLAGMTLEVGTVVRERLILAEELATDRVVAQLDLDIKFRTNGRTLT